MSKAESAWAIYAHYQRQLSRSASVDSRVWGLEAALNLVLAPEFAPADISSETFRRTAATAARRRRAHVSRCVPQIDGDVETAEPHDLLDRIGAQQVLSALDAAIPASEDKDLLVHVAQGASYDELARRGKDVAGSLRSRVCRMRRQVAHLRDCYRAV